MDYGFRASYHIQSSQPYADLSSQRCLNCMVCGMSVDEIKEQKTKWYMDRATPRGEPAYITHIRRVAYMGSTPAAYFSWHPQCRRLPPVMALGLQLRRPGKKPYRALYLCFKTNMKDKHLLFILSSFVLCTVIIISLLKVLFD